MTVRRYAVLLVLLAGPALAQAVPEDKLCMTPVGTGIQIGDRCESLPGERREIKPAQLPLHVADTSTLLRLRVVSDDTPDEPYDLSSLAGNDTVTELDLFREGPIDLTPLAQAKSLRALSLSIDAAKALSQLADTPPAPVRDLRLYAPGEVLDLSSLASWTGLHVLTIDAKGVTGQQALANLPDLHQVQFTLSEETDLSVLANASKLRVLYVRGTLGDKLFSDLSFLSGLTELEILSLQTNAISDITPLAGLTRLRLLDLSGNSGLSDISVLRNMPDLSNLQLRKTRITDLSPLHGLRNLQILWLDKSPVSDISVLASTPALWGLELSRTKVTDLSPLKGLPIKHLDLFGTQVTDISVLRDMPLQSVNLRNTPVTDFSAIPPKASLRK